MAPKPAGLPPRALPSLRGNFEVSVLDEAVPRTVAAVWRGFTTCSNLSAGGKERSDACCLREYQQYKKRQRAQSPTPPNTAASTITVIDPVSVFPPAEAETGAAPDTAMVERGSETFTAQVHALEFIAVSAR